MEGTMLKQTEKLVLFLLLALILSQSALVTKADAPLPAVSSTQRAPADDPSWPTLAANPARTSWTAEEVRGSLKPVWYKHFTPYISQKVQVIAVDNTLYISTSGGLYALDADTGAQKWLYATDLPLGHSPTVYNGVVYVGGFDHKIHAIRASDGAGLWTFEGGKGFQTNPLVIDVNGHTTVFAGNRDGVFYAIRDNGNSASLAWKYQTDGPILYSAAYADNTIYFASNDMHAYALNAQTGALVWKSAKLPGYGFHSWWPVVYRNYVVFNGGWNYRFVRPYPDAGNPKSVEGRGSLYPADGYIGPQGTESGDWAANTPTLNAYRITNYFEDKPWRRTTFVLNRSSGQEYTFDYDNDGKAEYAPFLYYGAKGGTRYPSAVGSDDVLYQANNYFMEGSDIPRGQVSGWKIDTPYISIPAGSTNAVDEPLAFSIGGNVVYTRLCCDREAKAFDLTTGQTWSYYDQGGNVLRRYLPDLFAEGWPYSYWKHGDPSAPVPYNGKVYLIANNAVVAFAANGVDPVDLPDLGADTGQSPDSIERGSTAIGLNTKVTLNSSKWPLLIQQETYYSTNYRLEARARYFSLLEVAGSTSPPSGLSESTTNIATIFSSTFNGSQTLTTRVSKRSPTILFHTTGGDWYLNGSLAGIAWPTSGGVSVATGASTINGSQLSEGWVMVWDGTSSHRWSPVILSFEKRPSQISFAADGLDISFGGSGGYLAVTPLYGMSAPQSTEETSWPAAGIPSATLSRIRLLDRVARSFPNDLSETWNIDDSSGDALFTYTYSYIEFSGDWGTSPQRIAYVPPRTALAAWNNSPIRINNQPLEQQLDLNYLTPVGRVAGVANASSVTVRLPGIARYWRDIPATPSPASAGDPAQTELSAQIQAMINAGHLRPGYGRSGIWDGIARNRLGDNLADLWHTPADTVYTLLRAMPLLASSSLQQAVKQYVQQEVQTYPLEDTKHIGWKDGAAREYFDLPPEAEAERSNFPPCNSSCGDGYSGWPLPPQNFYAMWMVAQEFGNANALFAAAQNKLDTSLKFQQSLPYFLNSYLQGHIGYLRLANLAGEGWQQDVEKTLIELLILKAATLKYPSALAETGFEYSGYQWSMRTYAPNHADTMFNVTTIGTLWSQMPLYGFKQDVKYGLSGAGQGGAYTYGIDFVELVPEVAHFLYDYTLNETQAAVSDYETRTPYWFVAEAEEMAGEGVLRPLYDTVALFQAKAQILGEERADMEKYLDVPAYAVGDLFYIQNLTALLEEGSYTGIADFSVSASPASQSIDPGDSATYTVQLTLTGNYTHTITLTAAASPELLVSLNPATLTPSQRTTATLTLTHNYTGTATVLLPGLYFTVPLTATGNGVAKTTSVGLLVGGAKTYLPVIFKN